VFVHIYWWSIYSYMNITNTLLHLFIHIYTYISIFLMYIFLVLHFYRQCPVCSRRIWHTDWPADHKQLGILFLYYTYMCIYYVFRYKDMILCMIMYVLWIWHTDWPTDHKQLGIIWFFYVCIIHAFIYTYLDIKLWLSIWCVY
jgi:hypothetical protein